MTTFLIIIAFCIVFFSIGAIIIFSMELDDPIRKVVNLPTMRYEATPSDLPNGINKNTGTVEAYEGHNDFLKKSDYLTEISNNVFDGKKPF